MDPTSQNHNTLIRDPNTSNFQKIFPENNTLMREREGGQKKKTEPEFDQVQGSG
jgi:hypothetical protein